MRLYLAQHPMLRQFPASRETQLFANAAEKAKYSVERVSFACVAAKWVKIVQST